MGAVTAIDGIAAPSSLLDGVETAVCRVLQIQSLKHRSAALEICGKPESPLGLVDAVYDSITENWRRCRALRPTSGSLENWRWRKPKLSIAAHNASPEVVLERAIVAAYERNGRTDVANQIPVASGVVGPFGERRRAIDLVRQAAPKHFELIELKVASDTPLYAAVEIIGYTVIWLLSRTEARGSSNALLAAERVHASVLAPTAYYARYRLGPLQAQLNVELAALGARHGVALSFGFQAFADHLAHAPFTDEGLMSVIDDSRAV